MSELIKYISDILNIKTDSVYTIQDMTEELSKIKDIVAYRSYIKDNLGATEVDYKTGFQKFLILTSKYIDLEFRAVAKIKFDLIVNEVLEYVTLENGIVKVKRGVTKEVFESLNGVKEIKKITQVNLYLVLSDRYMVCHTSHNGTSSTAFDYYYMNLKINEDVEIPYNKLDARLSSMTQDILGVAS